MLLIPAIDLLNNQVVRLKKGQETTAERFEETLEQLIERVPEKYRRLHLVNLSGALATKGTIPSETIKRLAQRFSVQYGGGLRNEVEFDELRRLGVDRTVIGTLWLEDWNKALSLAQRWGIGDVVASVDVLSSTHLNVKTRGWTQETQTSALELIQKLYQSGIKEFLITSIDQDGMMKGPDFKLYQIIRENFSDIYIIASGGFRNRSDLLELTKSGCDATVVGKAWLSNPNFFGEFHA